jgi:hypothetical protein
MTISKEELSIDEFTSMRDRCDAYKDNPFDLPGQDDSAVLKDAVKYIKSDLSVIPIRCDGSKGPIGKWKKNQTHRINEGEAEHHFSNETGIGIVCGAISDNLEVLDFDEPGLINQWTELVNEEAPGLLQRLPCVETPRGGMHLYYKCDKIGSNQKLAMEPFEDENGKPKERVLIETRGEGGYIIAPGSPAACHPLEKPYKLVNGDLLNIPAISTEERDILLRLSRSFDLQPQKKEVFAQLYTPNLSELQRPGDDFNQRASWNDILSKHGWNQVKSCGEVIFWRRPGESKHRHQANTGYCQSSSGDLLYVFSTEAFPLESGNAYSKFAAYTFLEHNGGFKEAAKALREKGYGSEMREENETHCAPESDSLGFSFVSIQSMIKKPPKDNWLIKGYLSADSLMELFGAPGTYKTFIILDMGLSVAAGKNWHGFPVKRQGPVFFIAGEGHNGLSRRLKAWGEYYDIDIESLPFFISSQPAQFLHEENAKQVVSSIEALAKQHGKPSLVIIDTLNRNFGPGDENTSADMTRFIRIVDQQIRIPYQCAVPIVHHSGLSDKTRGRGSSVLQAALDWEYCLMKKKDGCVVLSNTKVKDYEVPQDISFKPKTVYFDEWLDEDGEKMSSCVLHFVDVNSQECQPKSLVGQKKIAFDALVKAVDDHSVDLGNGFIGVHEDVWRKEAYKAKISSSADSKSKRQAFYRAKKDLLEERYVENQDLYYRPVET